MKRSTIKTIFPILLAAVILIASLCFGGYPGIASAYITDMSKYSSVIDDLRSDTAFNISDYPTIRNNYSLEVIQLAESSGGELFIYVYQPSGQNGDLLANGIRLSRTKGDNWRDYDLTFINSYGVFYKYVVKYFDVSDDTERFYDIVQITRKYESKYDPPLSDSQTSSDMPFPVAQCWRATTENGSVRYEMEQTEVVEIPVGEKFVGFRRITNGGVPWADYEACDSHFIVFNCDKQIDDLVYAEVTFETQSYRYTVTGGTQTYPPEEKFVPLKGKQTIQNKPYGAFGQTYEWQRIMRVTDFLKTSDFDEQTQAELSQYTWVLNFYETEFEMFNGLTLSGAALISPAFWATIPAFLLATNNSGTIVSDVSILNLEFETDGKTYNLGVVDNKQTGPQTPLPTTPTDKNAWKRWLIVAAVIVGVVILLAIIFPPFGKVLVLVFKRLFSVLLFPFTLIKRLIEKRSANSDPPSKPKRRKQTKTKTQ